METQTNNSEVGAGQISLIQKKLALEATIKGGVSWFYWIAGLSVINSVIFVVGGSFTFVVGLGFTQIVDGIMAGVSKGMGANAAILARIIGFGIDLVIAGFFVVIGVLGRRRYRWSVIVGMVIYGFDALIFIPFGEWLSVAFHGVALWSLWRGLQALSRLKALELSGPVHVPQSMTFTQTEVQIGVIKGGRNVTLVLIGLMVFIIVVLYIFVMMTSR